MAEVEIILSNSETLEAPVGRFPRLVGSVVFLLPAEQVNNSSSIPIAAWGDARCTTNLSFALAFFCPL